MYAFLLVPEFKVLEALSGRSRRRKQSRRLRDCLFINRDAFRKNCGHENMAVLQPETPHSPAPTAMCAPSAC